MCAALGDDGADPLRLKAQAVNRLLRPIADPWNIAYADLSRFFLEPDGRIDRSVMGDFLHPTKKGYEIFAAALMPELKKAFAD